MKKFIKGMKLSELFYKNIVKKILERNFPDLKYSAGLIGYGSEVLGYDTKMSADHNWGPRVMIFLETKGFNKRKEIISSLLSRELPPEFQGYSTNFTKPDKFGNQGLLKAKKSKLINHRIEFFTVRTFFKDYLNIDPESELKHPDWLILPEQKLRAVKCGKIFHDDLNLNEIRNKLDYYPQDIWLYLLASEWMKIGQEEPFVGRCGIVNDELGSKVVASRLVHTIMRLCFLMEKEYAPYSKWFGTAFSELKSSKDLTPILHNIFSADNWKDREKYLSEAYEILAEMHNSLKITKPVKAEVSKFHRRSFKVIQGSDFSAEILKQIKDPEVSKISATIGSVNQFTNTVDVLDNNKLLQKMKKLY